MTVQEILDFVAEVDPEAGHYQSANENTNYTVWAELRKLSTIADGVHVSGWSFQIDRFTVEEFDEIAARLEQALEDDERIAYAYQVDYERETGLIHHIFECQGF